MPDWEPEELVFNAIAWKEGYRIFGCSRDLSKIMSKFKDEKSEYTWLSTSLLHPNLDKLIIIRQNPNWKIL